MKVIDHINQAKKTLFSFEIIPPLKGQSIQHIFDAIDPLMDFKPPFIDVTYHREEYIYKKRENGLLERRTTRKRPGTVGICAAIMNRYNVDAVPHIICGGFTKEETEDALIDLNFLGIENVLVLRGDSIKSEPNFIPEPGGHEYAVDLLEQVVHMNKGEYIEEELQNANPTNFCIGVAGYPEKHIEAANMSMDLTYLKEKIDKGAEYIVTQMFFDNKKYIEFVQKCREMGITIPIIPGIKPMTTKRHLQALPKNFFIDIPEDLAQAVSQCKDNKAVREVGIEWAIQQSKELIEYGVPSLHYYTMGRSNVVRRIGEALF